MYVRTVTAFNPSVSAETRNFTGLAVVSQAPAREDGLDSKRRTALLYSLGVFGNPALGWMKQYPS